MCTRHTIVSFKQLVKYLIYSLYLMNSDILTIKKSKIPVCYKYLLYCGLYFFF